MKNEEILEQPEDASADAADKQTEDSNTLAPFEDTEQLLKAYKELQADYTRKSQLLLEYQQGNASVAVNEVPVVDPTPSNHPVTADAVPPLHAGGELAGLSRDEVIREYLTSVATKQTAPAVITASNDFYTGGNSLPKSLRDVEKVAEEFFRTKTPVA